MFDRVLNTPLLAYTVPYPEFFWAYRYMYRDRDFNEIIGERIVKQTDRQVMALLSCFSMPKN